MIQPLPVGEYLPDQPALGNAGLTRCENVIPVLHGEGLAYRPVPGFTPISNAMNGRVRGAVSARDSSDTTHIFAGTGTKLYKLAAATFSDISRTAGGAYALGSKEAWRFTQFGLKRVIGCAPTQLLQYYDLGTSTNFENLPGSPPRFTDVAVVREFIIGVNEYDGSTRHHTRVQWCGQNDSEEWTVGEKLSGYKDMDDTGAGSIKRVVGGRDFGYLVQERGIQRMAFVGAGVVWDIDEVVREHGGIAAGSVVFYRNLLFYLARDGFHAFNGSESVPIGGNKVDTTFLNDMDWNYLDRVSSAIDPENRLIFWMYSSATGANPDKMLCYNYQTNTWSQINLATSADLLVSLTSHGWTLEDLNEMGNLDAINLSLDDSYWKGGFPQVGVFTSDFKLGYLRGDSLAAVLETGEAAPIPGRRAIIRSLRPLVDGAAATCAVGHRTEQKDALVWTPNVVTNKAGVSPFRVNDRYSRFRLSVAAGANFDKITGLELDYSPTGGAR